MSEKMSEKLFYYGYDCLKQKKYDGRSVVVANFKLPAKKERKQCLYDLPTTEFKIGKKYILVVGDPRFLEGEFEFRGLAKQHLQIGKTKIYNCISLASWEWLVFIQDEKWLAVAENFVCEARYYEQNYRNVRDRRG